MKQLIQLVTPEARPLAILVAVLAAVSGLLSASLVAIGNHAINAKSEDPNSPALLLVAAFLFVGAGKLVSGYLSEVLLTRLCHSTIARIRTDLVRRVLNVPLRTYENTGSPRVFACLTEDVASVSQALSVMPGIIINLAIAAGASVYLLWLSPSSFSILATGALIGFAIYRVLAKRAETHWSLARSTGDTLHELYRAFTEGIKELKIHAGKRDDFLDRSLSKTANLHADQCITATKRYSLAHSLSHGFFFLIIGTLLFVLPRYGILERENLTGYVLTCLFLMGPISGIIYSIPAIVRARIANDKIAELGVNLQTSNCESAASKSDPSFSQDWKSLSLQNAAFTYRGEGSREFTAGPIQLEIPRGELLFITGSNGSGKTTLGKMLAGLYEPASGVFAMDAVAIDCSNRDAYRQHVSAVFADFHLFSELSENHSTFNVETARRYLTHLGLADAVSIDDANGRLSTTTSLSTGQRKRLALLSAYLDDRDIMIFDEWAADQDPQFRQVFYEDLLPALHSKGKTLIIITHDDRYFHCAERLVRIEDGQLHTLAKQNLKAITPAAQSVAI